MPAGSQAHTRPTSSTNCIPLVQMLEAAWQTRLLDSKARTQQRRGQRCLDGPNISPWHGPQKAHCSDHRTMSGHAWLVKVAKLTSW